MKRKKSLDVNVNYQEIMKAVAFYLKAYDRHEQVWDFEGSVGIPEWALLTNRADADLKLVRAQIRLRNTFKKLNKE